MTSFVGTRLAAADEAGESWHMANWITVLRTFQTSPLSLIKQDWWAELLDNYCIHIQFSTRFELKIDSRIERALYEGVTKKPRGIISSFLGMFGIRNEVNIKEFCVALGRK